MKEAAEAKKKGAADLDKKKFKEQELDIKNMLMSEINNNASLLD